MSFVFIRQALQLHNNAGLRERKLPSLRTFAEKYIKMLPDLVRYDGLGWAYGTAAGAYGQMHCISLLLQSLRDQWIPDDQKPRYFDILRRLFYFFYVTYLDQEHGYIVIRDEERTTVPRHTTRMANFDGARYLCQWSRLAKVINTPDNPRAEPVRTSGRFVIYDKSNRKEQGLFLYRDGDSGLHIELPLVGCHGKATADSLAFPHSPGVFDWPCNVYLPIMVPELTINGQQFVPSFYGKRCTTGLGIRNSYFFRYEQPELINTREEMVNGIGSCKVSWTFTGNKVTSEFVYTVKNQVQLDRFRYMLAIGAPHSRYRTDNSPSLGQAGLRCTVQKDDFQGHWAETDVVSNDPTYRSNYGKIHYLQTLLRDHPLIMRPGQTYRLIVSFEPDIATVSG
jgi:hypothetical protein